MKQSDITALHDSSGTFYTHQILFNVNAYTTESMLVLGTIIFKETTKEANSLDKARNMTAANYLFDQ